MVEYEEIMIKYVDGKLFKMYNWILDNLEKDPELIAGESPNKEHLQKFLQEQCDALEEFIQAGGVDERDNQDDADIFGEEDIVIAPGADDSGMTEFLDDEDDDDEGEEWKKG